MKILFNELSILEQFCNIDPFLNAFANLSGMDERIGMSILVHVNLYNIIASNQELSNYIHGKLKGEDKDKENKIKKIRRWLQTRPAYEERSDNDCEYKYEDENVTESAVGQAAIQLINGEHYGLFSLVPSKWETSPIEIKRYQGSSSTPVDIQNWWDADALRKDFENLKLIELEEINSWEGLLEVSKYHFEKLNFFDNCIDELKKRPFGHLLKNNILNCFEKLNDLVGAFDEEGQRTEEGDDLIKKHFGEGKLFSNSSLTERRKMRQKMMFRHSDGRNLFCPWHGKPSSGDKNNPFRIHFHAEGSEEGWPIRFAQPVYVAYVGPKLTAK